MAPSYLPKIYIITKLLSVARPDINLNNENVIKSVPKIVKTLPSIAIIFAIIKIGRRPVNKKKPL